MNCVYCGEGEQSADEKQQSGAKSPSHNGGGNAQNKGGDVGARPAVRQDGRSRAMLGTFGFGCQGGDGREETPLLSLLVDTSDNEIENRFKMLYNVLGRVDEQRTIMNVSRFVEIASLRFHFFPTVKNENN